MPHTNILQPTYTDLKTFFETLDEVMFSADVLSNRLIQISPACKKIYGYTQDEFYLNSSLWRDVIHPEDLPKSSQEFRFLHEGKKVSNRYRIIHKDGRVRWIENRIVPTFVNGDLVRIDGVTRDITTQVENEQELFKYRARAHAMMENALASIWSMDKGGNLLFFNRRFAELHYKVAGTFPVQGENILQYLVKTSKTNWPEIFLKVVGGDSATFESPRTVDNTECVFKTSVAPIVVNGEVTGLSCFTIDITDILVSEEKSKKSEANLYAIINSTNDSIFSIDKNYKITAVNNASIEAGYLVTGRRMKPGDDFLVSSAGTHLMLEWKTHLDRALNGETLRMQTVNSIAGQEVWAEFSFNPILQNDEVIGVTCIGRDVTVERRYAKKLRDSNELYELATKATNDAIWDWDLKTGQIFLSETYRDMLGYDIPNNVLPTSGWLGHIHHEDRERVKTDVFDAIYHQKLDYWEGEYRMIRNDDTEIFVYDRGYILFDENREPFRMVGALADITHRKIADEQLQRSEANLRNIFENTDTAYVLLNCEAEVLSCNKIAVDLSRKTMTSEICEGKNYLDLMPVGRRTAVKDAIGEVIKNGRVKKYEIEYSRPEGHIWLLISMHPIFNNDNVISGLSIGARNITHRKTAENELLRSEANLRTMFNNTAIGYVMLDKTFKVVSFNQRAAERHLADFGKPLREGQHIFEHLPDEKKITATANYAPVLKGEKLDYEYKVAQPDGSNIWYHLSVMPVVDGRGGIHDIILAGEDITERKNTELEREKMTTEIVQRNRDLEQFAYIISHNLRAPVANITGLSNILLGKRELSFTDREKCLQGLALSVNKLDEVIIDLNHILQVRREINEKKETVLFSSVVNNIKTSINNLIVKENALIKTDFLEINEFFTLKSYINSVFYNLILNSIKYRSPDRDPVISIRSRMTGNKLELTFTDNGLGIDLSSNANKVFGLYKKFHSHTDGKGMGLYMVKTQVEILGGKISIDSEVDAGTTFRIEFEMQ